MTRPGSRSFATCSALASRTTTSAAIPAAVMPPIAPPPTTSTRMSGRRHRAIEGVGGCAGELGDDARGDPRAGAGLDEPADGVDRGGIGARALRGAAHDEHDLAARGLVP